MGFFQTCSEALLHLLSFTPYSEPYSSQQPLALDDVTVYPEKASPGFTCHYPALPGWKSCNGPNSRDCWLNDTNSPQPLFTQYNIKTNYETQWPQGIRREYWLNISDQTISPDGYLKPEGKVLNNTYPGPLIEACWGDDITIHVTNHLKTNGSTIHWHGIRQLHTNAADGVNGVTQCPIATGDTYTYNFKAVQYGSTWYHSHYSLQYPDGVAGPLVIHGPHSANWDEASDPILISDWVHSSSFSEFYIEIGNATSKVRGREPPTDTVLLGGTGDFKCDAKDPRCLPAAKRKPIFNKVFQKGKRYLLRLINSSVSTSFVFSIDHHELEVISTDFVPIKPYKTKSIHIGIGQRYNVIVEANPSQPLQKDGNYWIRTQVSENCGNVTDFRNLTGIIRYDAKSTALPTSSNQTEISTLCADEPLASLVPIVPWQIDSQAVNDVLNDTFQADIDSADPTLQHGALRWDLTNYPMWLNFSNPTILNIDNPSALPNEYAIVPENYDRGYVYLVITSNFAGIQNETKQKEPIAFAAHPIHLHGHDFVVLAQSSDPYVVTTSPHTFNFHNPPRRDVALLPLGGYLAIAFKPDNPGIWLLHCHIAWHASSGLAMQILERQHDIYPTIGNLQPTKDTCKSWDHWFYDLNHGTFAGFEQDDSGV